MRLKFMPFMLCFLFLISGLASAQPQKTFAVLPFQVHGPQEYQYLSQGIQSMLSSRLARPGQSSSISPGEISREIAEHPGTAEQAREFRARLGADFLVYGTITIMEKETSLDVFTVSADKSLDPILKQPPLTGLIPSLEEVASDLMAQAIPETRPLADSEPAVIETTPSAPPRDADTYVSPHFRFEDDPYAAGRWRSQTLAFNSVGFALGKTSPDDPKTIFILGDNKVHAYRLQEGRMMPLAVYDAPLTYQCLTINTFDINRDGSQEIVVSAVQDDRARSFILSFENNKFQVLHERIPFYINVAMLPPDFRPELIGQSPAAGTRLFNPGSVQEVIMTSAGPELGRSLSLPPNANIFNFNYLPQDDSHLVVIAEHDRLKVYNSAHSLIYTTSDEYSGTNLGLELHSTMPGLGRTSPGEEDPDFYYIPTRLLPIRLGSEKNFSLLAHKHHGGLSRVFTRMRNFPEGEIRALFWDDIGLNVLWNTRKIRASIVDFGVYDFDNDGQEELVVLVNSHPVITGLQDSSSILLAYKMDPETMGGSR
jgi:hypothetical protein